jgi:hypothetical protein
MIGFRRSFARHDWLHAALLPLALAISLAACASSEAQVTADPNLPPGAIRTGEGVYMVPIAPDAGGCMQYRMYAPGKAVVQMIYYRQADGGVTADRA